MEATKDAMKKRMLQIPIIKKQKLQKTESIKSSVINRLVFDVLQIIKSNHISWSRSELIRKLAWDVFENQELLTALESNSRVILNRQDQSLTYSPLYKINNAQELILVLKNCFGVMDIKILADSWPDIYSELDQMQESRQVLIINVKDEPRYIALDEPELYLEMDQEYKDYYSQVAIPDQDLVLKELRKAGLKEAQVASLESKTESSDQVVKKKKFNKRTRITNTHLEGYDVRNQ
jgi:hypothetical protein